MAGKGLVLGIMLSLLGASSADAATPASTFPFREPASSSVVVPGTNAYTARITAVKRSVTISVQGRDGTAEYTTRRRGRGRRVRANLGKLGRISLRFRPSGRRRIEKPIRGCRGTPRVHRFGIFVGSIVFNGEDHYTQVRKRRERGVVSSARRWRCRSDGVLPDSRLAAASAGRSASPPGAVELVAKDRDRRLSFVASSFEFLPGLHPSLLHVSTRERLGPVRIVREDYASEINAFTHDDPMTRADIVAPDPFRGSAAYRLEPDGTASWTGDLSADLPGTDWLQLTGSSFAVRLRRCRSALDCRP